MFNKHQTTDDKVIEKNIANDDTEIEGNFPCNQCEYKTQLTYDYMAHAKYAHSTEQTLLCDKCDFQTDIDDEFVSHLSLIHKKKIESPFD